MTQADQYPIQIYWSEEENGFIAIAPDLPGCTVVAETETQALVEIRTAIQERLSLMVSIGNPIPEPSRAPLERTYSGKILVRMPQTLHRNLAAQAEQEGTSLNQYLVYLLTASHTKQAIKAPAIEVMHTAQASSLSGTPVTFWGNPSAASEWHHLHPYLGTLQTWSAPSVVVRSSDVIDQPEWNQAVFAVLSNPQSRRPANG